MEEIARPIVHFLHNQGFVIVSTLDSNNKIHCSAKGIIGVDQNKIYLFDLYLAKTFNNLEKNPTITITAIDEHEFTGFALKGVAHLVESEKVENQLMEKWEERLINRISKRVIKNVKKDKGSLKHPETRFPKPKYLIEVEVEEIVDLTPLDLKTPAV